MSYPKNLYFITSFEEWKENPDKLDEFVSMVYGIKEIENLYITVKDAHDNVQLIDERYYPYGFIFIKDNGREEIITKQYAHLQCPDLIIKTGVPCLTNALLWHTAYSEYMFTEKPLKLLNVKKLKKRLGEFQTHHRTFGM